ncbi:MAG: magnesium transporter [Clostridia bacterium]|nr:magnesium transporter [Clostridia bacterium]
MDEMLEKKYEELRTLLLEKKHRSFLSVAIELSPVDLADFLSSLDDEMLLTAFRLLPKDVAAETFAELDSDAQEKIVLSTNDARIGQIIDELAIDDAVDVLQELPASMVKRILRRAQPETRALINKFLSYPEGSAGSVMTAEFLSLSENFTVGEAVEHIRGTGIDKETVYVAYITDGHSMLRGIVSLRDLLFASKDTRIGDIMETDILSATTHEHQETVAEMISRYDLLALPITDNEGRLVGIVTVDDAVDVLKEEATEDIEKMAGIAPSDKPYMKDSVTSIYKKRIPWLLLLMLLATITGGIISHFDSLLGSYVLLTAFMPMLMNSGGNAGGQTSVTVIRALALDEVQLKDIFRVWYKELRVALLSGLTLGAVNFVKTMLIDFKCDFSPTYLLTAAIVSLTLVFVVPVANLIGASLPILAKRLGFDPAVMASPFITTIVDAVSLLIFFSLAAVWL